MTGSAGGSGCGACAVAKDALPWLAPFIEPAIEDIAQQVGSSVLAWLAAIFAF